MVKEVHALVRNAMPARAVTAVRPVRTAVSAIAYKGSAVSCPACGGRFRAFQRFNHRAAARCPRCQALERHRLLGLYLRRCTDLFERPQSVLHIAPEPFFQYQLRRVHGEGYVCGDLNSPDDAHRLDVTDLHFPDAAFDVVLCSHVFEHVPNDRRAMAELFRVLRPGGWGILDAPVDSTRATTFEDRSVTSPRHRRRLFGQWDHVRMYGRDYPELLGQAGFKVDLDPFTVTSDEVRLHGLRPDRDHIYLCLK